ncbi:WD repeat-containing protein 63 [Lingula anatina]|uniref:WD repeat-containing protein 63 n=1 Tax=Lingula anatina TaxID=7574 RepID=A0A1S3JCZ1_LINAN|nr:WD repeat-containing protein 63 [Lingula anatina]|eukprot:XP_013408046.1 WD repeat-containing protein 63 [Lingula anatina]
MADNEESEKEKQQEEKEMDTLSPPKTAEGGSKPGSAKSRQGSAKSRQGSAKSGSPPKTPASGKGSAKGKPKSSVSKTKEPAEEKKEEPIHVEGPGPLADGPLPEGCQPIFLATKTQELFEVTCGEQITEDHPYKLVKKEDILADLRNRAAVCDFSVFKPQILDYPGEEILLIYDADFKHGQNFVIALTEECKNSILHPPKAEGEGGTGEGGEGGEEEEEVEYKYIPPVPKDWVSQGSEKEIEEENVFETRPRIKISIKRVRREFGTPVEFSDRNVADAKDGYLECTPYEDKTFELKAMEIDKSVQAIPHYDNTGTQTDWKHPRNSTTQYMAREFDDKEKKEAENAERMGEFLESVAPRFDLALQQNEIMNVFYDDWMGLADEDGSFGSKADNHLKEYQSFTDLQFSKDKTITCIEWHPTIKGVVAVSVSEKMSFDQRIDQAAKVIMNPSLILIWSFLDPIHPQLLLEAPEDIQCFKFCPTDPNIVAGGCLNGQLVLWDISAHAERLRTPRSNRKKTSNTLPGFEDESALDIPIVRYCAVSSIDHSHKAAITDLLWIPDHMELNRMGIPQENKQQQCVQIMTCATDHCVLVWDTRSPKGPSGGDDKGIKNPMGVPNTFKYLDLTWKPHLKVTLMKSEPGGDHSPIKFSIQEKQGDRSVLAKLESQSKEDKSGGGGGGGGGFGFGKPGSGKEKRTLQDVKTHFYVGGEEGEIIYVDWMPQKDQDSGKILTPKPDFYNALHDGPVNTLQRSAFFKDIVLCVGGWTWSIWKEGVNSGPILSSSASTKHLTAAHWSPSRAGVFYVTREDGSIEVWDLLDKTHEPSLVQSISSAPITSIYPYQISSKQHLLAVGDNLGTLHILEIPWSLRVATPNETVGVSNYFDREVKRRAFVVDRWNFREQEKREIEAEHKRKAGIAPNVELTEEEVHYRMKQQYAAFLEEESAFLRELGLKEDIDEPLPEV